MFYHDYTIDSDGYIKKVKDTQDKYDILYALQDYESGKLENGLKIDKKEASSATILDDLALERNDFNGSYAESDSKDIAFKVFHYAADNTDVEWSISGFGKGRVDKYTVTTSHEHGYVTLGTTINGYDEFSMIFNIHSHPSVTGTKGGSYVKGVGGDMYNIIDRYYRFQNKGINPTFMPKEYIYHKYGKTLYNYTPWNPSIYIRSIKNASDLHRGLGF